MVKAKKEIQAEKLQKRLKDFFPEYFTNILIVADTEFSEILLYKGYMAEKLNSLYKKVFRHLANFLQHRVPVVFS